MNNKSKILLISIFFLLSSLACALPFISNSGQTQTEPTLNAPTAPEQQTPTTALLFTSIATLEEIQTPINPVVDLSNVVLKQADLPQGFQILDAEAQKTLSVTPDDVLNLFQNSFTQAKPASYFAFLNANTDSYQFVLGTLFAPLTPAEITAFDAQLSDPAKAIQSFVSGMGGTAMAINGADRLGERSIGFTFTLDAQTMTLRGDMILARRKDVVLLIMSMYRDGIKPPADIISLAALLDQRLDSALGH